MWRWVSSAAVLVLVTGLLPVEAAVDVLVRVAPVLVFLVAITVVAELADGAGVFEVAARWAAVSAHGSAARLFGLVALVAVAVTVLMSLDTTAVMLTPLVLVLSRRLGLDPVPFAVLVVWLANTASLLLPVSNLTNLLAAPAFRDTGASYLAVMALPATLVVLTSVLLLGLWFRRRLQGGFALPGHLPVADRGLLAAAAAACAGIGVAVAAGVEPAVASVVGLGLLLPVVLLRAPSLLTARLLPWRLALLTVGLFLVVQAAADRGLAEGLAGLAGQGTAPGDLLRLAVTGALASNAVNNLPAYLALERVAVDEPLRLAALLVGTNAGPLVTPWASVATLLWWDRCRAHGMRVPVRQLVLLGLVGVPLVVCSGVAGLVLLD